MPIEKEFTEQDWSDPLLWLLNTLEQSYVDLVDVNRSTKISDYGTWYASGDSIINSATGETKPSVQKPEQQAQWYNAANEIKKATETQRAMQAVMASGADAMQKAMYYYEEQNKDNNMARYPAYTAMALQLANYEAQNLSKMNRNNMEQMLDMISPEWRTTLTSSGTAAQRAREATDFYTSYAIEDFATNEESIMASLDNALAMMNGEMGEDTRNMVIEQSQSAAAQNGVFGQAAEYLKATNLANKSIEIQGQGEQLLQATHQAEAQQMQTILNQIQAPVATDQNYINHLKTIALGGQVGTAGLFQGALQSITQSGTIDSGSFQKQFLETVKNTATGSLAGFDQALQAGAQQSWSNYNNMQGEKLASLAKKESQALNINSALTSLSNLAGQATGYFSATQHATEEANAALEEGEK